MLRPLALVATALAIVGCTPAATTSTTGPAQPAEERAERQVLRIGGTGWPNNPTPQGGATFPWYFMPMYDALTFFNPGFQVIPALATKWELSADGMTWTFTLRNDVKWPDGATLTAEDVVFTWETIKKNNWPQASIFPAVREVRAANPTTAEFLMSTKDLTVPNGGAQFRVIQKTYFERIGFDEFVRRPQGSGPYEMVEYKAGDLTRYKKKATKHPFRDVQLDELVFLNIPDIAQQVNGLRLGELDIVNGSFGADQQDALRAAGIVIVTQEFSTTHVNFALSAMLARPGSPFLDKRVREAVNYAVDKEAIARSVFRGQNRAVGQMGTPGSPWWDDTVPVWPYNPARARQLLAEAGYANGFKATYDHQVGVTVLEQPLAIQAYLKEVGIEMEIIQNLQAAFLDKYFGRQPKADLFPLQTGETTGFFQSFRNAYVCGPTGQGLLGLYCNPEIDRLFAEAYAESDPAKRATIFKQANRVMRGDVMQLWMITVNGGAVHRPQVKGLNLVTPTAFNYDSVYVVK